MSESETLKKLTSAQKTQLETIMVPEHYDSGFELIRQGEPFENAYIVKSGELVVEKDGNRIARLKKGDFVGEIFALQKHGNSTYSYKTLTNVELFAINYIDMNHYIQKNPRVYMNLYYFYEENK